MNKSRSTHDKSREVMNKLHTSWALAEALKDLKTTILGGWVGGGWFNSDVRLRLSQPQAGDWAWVWAELGNSGHFVVCQQSTARTTTAGTPHARANLMYQIQIEVKPNPSLI